MLYNSAIPYVIRKWDTQTGAEIGKFAVNINDFGIGNHMNALAISPANQNLLFSGGQDAISRLWDTSTDTIFTYSDQSPFRQIQEVELSNDGKLTYSQKKGLHHFCDTEGSWYSCTYCRPNI